MSLSTPVAQLCVGGGLEAAARFYDRVALAGGRSGCAMASSLDEVRARRGPRTP
jgi:hypothetical protein